MAAQAQTIFSNISYYTYMQEYQYAFLSAMQHAWKFLNINHQKETLQCYGVTFIHYITKLSLDFILNII